MAACYCQVASTKLAGGLRPDLMGQVSTSQKPQAPLAGLLAAAAKGLTCALTSLGESLDENLWMEAGRRTGQVCCAAGQAPFLPLIKVMASIYNSLASARKMGPAELA